MQAPGGWEWVLRWQSSMVSWKEYRGGSSKVRSVFLRRSGQITNQIYSTLPIQFFFFTFLPDVSQPHTGLSLVPSSSDHLLLLFTLVPRHRCLCRQSGHSPRATSHQFSHLVQPLFASLLPGLIMLNCLVFSSHLRFPELSFYNPPRPFPGRTDHLFYLCLLISQDNVNSPHFGFCLSLYQSAFARLTRGIYTTQWPPLSFYLT